MGYFARIRIGSGEGFADECYGFIDIPKTEYRHVPTVWHRYDEESVSTKIIMYGDLWLFKISKDEIVFRPRIIDFQKESPDNGEIRKPYKNLRQRALALYQIFKCKYTC